MRAIAEADIGISPEIEAEVIRTASRKFKVPEASVRRAMSDYLAAPIRVAITGVVTGVCRDPKDDHILECAVKSQARVIVSGDKDLLTLGIFQGIRMLTARQYLESS